MNGTVLWRKSYAYPGKNSHFVSSTGFKRLQSGDFLMLTLTDSTDTAYNVGLSVPRLRRIDPNGNVVSEHYLPVDNHSSWLYEFTELENGDLAFTGSIRSKTYIGRPEFGGISYFFRWSANVLFLTDGSLNLRWITVSDADFYGSQTGFPDLYRLATLNLFMI